MKKILLQGAVLLGWTSTVLAAGGPPSEEMGPLVILFLGMGALIVIFQLIPSVVIFFTMVREIFSSRQPKAAPAREPNQPG